MKISRKERKAEKKASKAEKKAAKAHKKAEPKGAAAVAVAGLPLASDAFVASGKVIPTGVHEASDVCLLPGDQFLAVSDIHSSAGRVSHAGPAGAVALAGITGAESGLEGVAYNAATNTLVVSREEVRELHVYDWDAMKSTPPSLARVVEVPLAGKVNKGVEGLAILAAHLSPTGRDQLLLVKEADPHVLGMLEADGTGKLVTFKLDARANQACTDFSGVSVDPKTGHVWICSDETARAVELKLTRAEDGSIHADLASEPLELVDAKGQKLKRVEGIAFDEKGDLFILTENDKVLHHYARS